MGSGYGDVLRSASPHHYIKVLTVSRRAVGTFKRGK